MIGLLSGGKPWPVGALPNHPRSFNPFDTVVALDAPPDLHTQLESLIDQVYDSELNWRFDDRLDQVRP